MTTPDAWVVNLIMSLHQHSVAGSHWESFGQNSCTFHKGKGKLSYFCEVGWVFGTRVRYLDFSTLRWVCLKKTHIEENILGFICQIVDEYLHIIHLEEILGWLK